VTVPNRVVVTAMVTRLSGEDGAVNDNVMNRYLRFARGEPGLIVVEAMGVHGYRSGPLLRIGEDRFVPGLAELARRVHAESACKIVPQIIHFLKIARSGWRQTIHDLSREEIALIVRQYGDAAARTRTAGFDGVELHMAHAYTLSSFLSLRNARPDDYGGTLENRMRAMTEVILEVRRRVGDDFPVGVRFDGEECITNGYGLTDSREIALRMAMLGVDYISISAGGKFEDAVHKTGQAIYPYTGYSGDRCMPPATYQDAYNTYLSDGIRAHLRARGFSTPIVATGKIREPALAESILARGSADAIGLARTVLADADWPKKTREGREDRIVRCLCINVCKALDENFKTVRCYLWPRGRLWAPDSTDTIAPTWPKGAGLKAELRKGSILLTWNAAADNEAVYGYEIFRSADGRPFEHLWTTRADMKTRYEDGSAAGGATYRYFVRAYDLAGNRSPESELVTVPMPLV
jgi:2,4-dienoyl-CoA reductase-like NADH-dependent reductase (Old Yellow Enzyme family)